MGFLPCYTKGSPINVKISGFVELDEAIILVYLHCRKYIGIYDYQKSTFHSFFVRNYTNDFRLFFHAVSIIRTFFDGIVLSIGYFYSVLIALSRQIVLQILGPLWEECKRVKTYKSSPMTSENNEK